MIRGAIDSDSAVTLLRRQQSEFNNLGVERLFMFGSTAREEADGASDVDLFFDHPRGSMSLFAVMDVKDLAKRVLGQEADVMSRRSPHPILKAAIESSAQRVF